jgi:hypothetical protein
MQMKGRSWTTLALLATNAVLLALLLIVRQPPAAWAQASEGRTDKVIAIAAPFRDESLLYVIDTSREVILVYGFHSPGTGTRGDVRTGAFEFLAGRLYQWDLLLATKREYSIKGVRTLRGLRVHGPGSSEEECKSLGK